MSIGWEGQVDRANEEADAATLKEEQEEKLLGCLVGLSALVQAPLPHETLRVLAAELVRVSIESCRAVVCGSTEDARVGSAALQAQILKSALYRAPMVALYSKWTGALTMFATHCSSSSSWFAVCAWRRKHMNPPPRIRCLPWIPRQWDGGMCRACGAWTLNGDLTGMGEWRKKMGGRREGRGGGVG